MIIAIDGPSGAGKSTLGRLLARALNLLYIDTGAMYRAAALAVLESNVSTTDERAVAEVVKQADINLAGDPDSLQVMLDGRDVSEEIRTEEVSHSASVISTIPEVRRTLVNRQREMGKRAGGVVLDGRDIGTIVFPQADLKFFLTAAPEARAHRRYEDERLKERDATFEATLADINARDRRDSTRNDSPLAIADDALVIDSTELSIEEVFERMMEAVRERHGEAQRRGGGDDTANAGSNGKDDSETPEHSKGK
jgi:cytidylate kinase